jgi:hypothetical protein
MVGVGVGDESASLAALDVNGQVAAAYEKAF